ncbi:MAG TPA: hypothetical protein VGC41_18475 [Kofleriaceae bacterium]
MRLFAHGAALAASLAACIDQPVSVPGPGQTTSADRLSQLNVYAGTLADLVPVAGVAPYDVNVSLYADFADKQRFVWLPEGARFGADADRWDVPTGTYFIKNFFFPNDARDPSAGRRIVETRFLIQGDSGLTASTYVWNDEQTEAFASGGNVDVAVHWIDSAGVTRDESVHVPGSSLCASCHDNRPLGWRTRQMPDPTELVALGILDHVPPPGITLVDPTGTADLDARARSYLDANCSHCHASTGDASGTGVFFDYEHTDAAHLPLCKHTSKVSGNDRIIVPGHPEQSALISRMFSDDAFVRMPRGPTRIPDLEGTAVLNAWIAQMPAGCP